MNDILAFATADKIRGYNPSLRDNGNGTWFDAFKISTHGTLRSVQFHNQPNTQGSADWPRPSI